MGKRVVTVVAAVLVAGALGVGGAFVASRTGQRAPATLPALQAADGQAASTSGAASAQGTPAAPLPGQRARAPGGGAEPDVVPPQVRYQVRGELPELGSSARAWTLDDQVTSAQVAALAGRLGLAGAGGPRPTGSGWTVSDGRRELFVNRLPGVPWTYAGTRFVCGGTPGGVTPKGAACASIEPLPNRLPPSAPRPRPPQPPELPDRGQAERIARDLLARVGAPVDGAELQMVRGLDRWFVSASPRVGDLPTMGLTWTAGVGSKGQVLSASGWLAAPRPADTYPLITVRQALDRLRNRPVGGPVIERQPGDRAPTAVRPAPCQPPSELPARCAAGPVTVDVTGARLGLQLATVLPPVGGSGKIPRSYLVPAYFFQIDGTWTEQVAVIAVQDRFLTAPPSTVVPLRSG